MIRKNIIEFIENILGKDYTTYLKGVEQDKVLFAKTLKGIKIEYDDKKIRQFDFIKFLNGGFYLCDKKGNKIRMILSVDSDDINNEYPIGISLFSTIYSCWTRDGYYNNNRKEYNSLHNERIFMKKIQE